MPAGVEPVESYRQPRRLRSVEPVCGGVATAWVCISPAERREGKIVPYGVEPDREVRGKGFEPLDPYGSGS